MTSCAARTHENDCSGTGGGWGSFGFLQNGPVTQDDVGNFIPDASRCPSLVLRMLLTRQSARDAYTSWCRLILSRLIRFHSTETLNQYPHGSSLQSNIISLELLRYSDNWSTSRTSNPNAGIILKTGEWEIIMRQKSSADTSTKYQTRSGHAGGCVCS